MVLQPVRFRETNHEKVLNRQNDFMAEFAIHIFDPDAVSESFDGAARVHPGSINDSALVSRQLSSVDHDSVCCLVSAGLVPDGQSLKAAREDLFSSGASIGLLPSRSGGDLAFVWKQLSAVMAGFVMPPESRGAILIDMSRWHEASSEQVVQSVQELVIRSALQNPESVTLLDSSGDVNESSLPSVAVDLPDLTPRHPDSSRDWMMNLLTDLQTVRCLTESGSGESCEVEALFAGLLQVNDYLDESHQHSQSIEGQGDDVNGDYWHGIMHRREPDYGNAKYWFRRVGCHPCFSQLRELATLVMNECNSTSADSWKSRLVSSNQWNAAAFVDLCETAAESTDDELTTAAKRIQWGEMLLLLEHTFRQASRRQ
ncbi:MAG: hypothetical protein O3B13_24260 [Planctomycetota bacterium]|nr:hypothetical protein [Planctomycetota bacterium]